MAKSKWAVVLSTGLVVGVGTDIVVPWPYSPLVSFFVAFCVTFTMAGLMYKS